MFLFINFFFFFANPPHVAERENAATIFFSICILELKKNEIKLTLSVFLPGCKVAGIIYSSAGTLHNVDAMGALGSH